MPKKQAAKDSNVIDTTKTRTRINSNVEFEERGYRREDYLKDLEKVSKPNDKRSEGAA